MSIGIGAMIAGLFSLVFANTAVQIASFTIFALLSFIILRKISKKAFDVSKDQTNIYGLVGKKANVIVEINPGGKGHIKIGGEEWSAVSEDDSIIPVGTVVTITTVKGNKAVVKQAENNRS